MLDRIVSLRAAECYVGCMGFGGEVKQRLTAVQSELSKRASNILGAFNVGSDRVRAESNFNETLHRWGLLAWPAYTDYFRQRGLKFLDGE